MSAKKKIVCYRGFILGMLFFPVFFMSLYSQSLIDLYKEGPVVLKNAAGYGEKTDWRALFYNTFTDIVTAPGGTVFAASSRQHKIFKFDAEGNLVKTFGQKGQGPGDINSPGDLSILDGKYLVVAEYPLHYRISLFDLEGQFHSLLKTELAVYHPTAICEGTVAYVGIQHRKKDGRTIKIESVRIKDIKTGSEKNLCTFEFPMESIKLKKGTMSFGESTAGRIYIARGFGGSLIVANSMNSELDIYNIAGKRTATIPLNIDPVPVTKQFLNDYKKMHLDQMRGQDIPSWASREDMMKAIKKADFSLLFGDHLPFYKELLVDEQGNILIFIPSVCIGDCPINARIYSKSGEFCCETEIKHGDYQLILDSRRKHMCFTSECLYALVQPKNAEGFLLRLIKVTY
jgi:hypothetical protein